MLYLKIMDEKGKEIQPSELTDTGCQQVRHDCGGLLAAISAHEEEMEAQADEERRREDEEPAEMPDKNDLD